jgi:lipid II:glycine glycyltransferase (peptidoglycan interpeptide bridge formation enzyme)
MKIELLEHNQIIFKEYDACILKSNAGTVYAMSWYLDIVSPNWSLLMADDYAFVMPLPNKLKYGIKYLIQPYFCQQLGIFAKSDLSEEIVLSFVKAIPYKYSNIQLNTSNVFKFNSDKLRPNFVLNLNSNIEIIRSSFKKNCIRNIKKAQAYNQQITEIDADTYITFLSDNASDIFNNQMLKLLNELILQSVENGSGKILAAFYEGVIVAAVFVVFFKSKIYYLSPVSSKDGKEMQSMSLLVNDIIENNCRKFYFLDFEGSAIPGVANFYAGFGAIPEYYPLFKKVKVF